MRYREFPRKAEGWEPDDDGGGAPAVADSSPARNPSTRIPLRGGPRRGTQRIYGSPRSVAPGSHVPRWIPDEPGEEAALLEALGIPSVDALFADVPKKARIGRI